MSDSIPQPPDGYRQHPLHHELSANRSGEIMRWNIGRSPNRWTKVSLCIGNAGYGRVWTANRGDGKKKCLLVHTVVFECLNGSAFNWSCASGSGLTINHRDGDKTNNCIENLEAISSRENIRTAQCKHGLPAFVTKQSEGFQVQATVRGVKRYGGYFLNLQDAADAVQLFLESVGHEAARHYKRENA